MKTGRLATIFFIIFLTILNPIQAQGNLMIMPKRIIFEDNDRSHNLNLINSGADTTTFSIDFIQYKMTDNGNFEEISENIEGFNYASDFLRYYPRRVTLGPKESQSIKVQLRRTGNLEDGEYRSHMSFVPTVNQGALDKKVFTNDEININIQTVIGISIPVIIRKGKNRTKIDISDIFLNQEKDLPEISITLNREGNMSTYGDLIVTHISSKEKLTEIGVIKGISVYTPNDKRIITIPLKNLEKVDLSTGQLKIEYQEKKGELIGEAIYNLK